MLKTFEVARDLVPATPSLVIDERTTRENIQRLQTYADSHRLKIRPHTKTHKSVRIAGWQIASGASGLTCAKVGEAERLSEATGDLLIAYPIADRARAQRLAELAVSKTVRVSLDHSHGIDLLKEAARSANSQIGILIDLDVGSHRTGVQSIEESLALAKRVEQAGPALRLDGLFFYPGQIWNPPVEQAEPLKKIDAYLQEAISQWHLAGLNTEIVSGGSTPTMFQSHFITAQTEIRPGTYVFNDLNTYKAGFCELSECSAAIICTVVSSAVPGKIVLDGGTKTFTSDRNVKFPDSGYGMILEFPDAIIQKLSEEHGEVDISQVSNPPKVGDRVTVIPNHICPCVNLQDKVWLINQSAQLEPLTIHARGCLV